MSIANRIHTFREGWKLTYQQFADAVGVSKGAVQQWEKGVTAPKRANQPAVAKFMGVTVAELMDAGPGGMRGHITGQHSTVTATDNASNQAQAPEDSAQAATKSVAELVANSIGPEEHRLLKIFRQLDALERAKLLLDLEYKVRRFALEIGSRSNKPELSQDELQRIIDFK